MTNEVKVAITNAIYEVYARTTEPYQSSVCSRPVSFTVPDKLGDHNVSIKIARNVRTSRGPVYELYIGSDNAPFMAVFGCWPIGFVADIFVKTLEHYHDWY